MTQALELFREALLIRRVEEKLLQLFSEGRLSGTIHSCVGQEFSAIAFAGQLQKGDFVFSNHRCHGHYISFLKDHEGLIAEILGKKTGVCSGIGGSQHLCGNNFYSNGIQGGIVPVAAGMALAKKLCNSNSIGVVFIGDGTLGQGVVYETMNIISKWDIPLLIICENNYYAQSTKSETNLAGDIIKRAEAFGIRTLRSETFSPQDLVKKAKESIDMVRKEKKPVFHLVETYRLYPHSKGDDHRDPAEIETFRNRDPLYNFARENQEAYEQLLIEVDSSIDVAIKRHLSADEISIKDYYPARKEEAPILWIPIESIKKRQGELINDFFMKSMAADDKVIFMGEDVLSPYGGAFKIAKGLSVKYPERVFATPISEPAITGIANGLALAGFRPFLEIMFGDFVTLCMDQIINHASKFHHMYNAQVSCPVVIRTPMGGYRGYGPTHSQTLDKFLIGIDNITTLALNSLIDPSVIYENILESSEHPVIVIENKADYAKRIADKRLPHYKYERTKGSYPLAKISPVFAKPTITLVTYGGMVDLVLSSLPVIFEELELITEVYVLTQLSPLNPLELNIVRQAAEKTKKLFVVEEGSAFAGVGSEIITSVVEESSQAIKLGRVASLPLPIPSSPSLEKCVLPDVGTIIKTIKERLA
ncbi:MAG: pyruvate dehydrogenase [Candidatus Saganbacteria bacterium]|nr:pyruvate dehydrogenase [Candidatus Saganbacteria bacterium]